MPDAVAIVPCASYRQDLVDGSVDEALSLLGGMPQFIRPGATVLLKPNLLSASPPEKVITTHPSIVEAVVRVVQAAGGDPIIGDSPGSAVRYTEKALRTVYDTTGMTGVAERTGARLMLDTRSRQISVPGGRLAKRIEVIQPVLDADVIINLPKLKTHVLTAFTGAVKNTFGIVPGAKKALLHATPRTLANFVEVLLDIHELSRPALTVMDGVLGMEGDGPSGGRPKQVGVVLASPDGVALDAIAVSVTGIPLDDVQLLRHASSRGLWSGRIEDIRTLGSPLNEVMVSDFVPARPNRHPEGAAGISWIDRYLAPTLVNWLAVKPVPISGRCTACGTCVRACPLDAIEIRDATARVDYGRCIRCYCCHEMCPEEAIDLEQPWLSRVLGTG